MIIFLLEFYLKVKVFLARDVLHIAKASIQTFLGPGIFSCFLIKSLVV